MRYLNAFHRWRYGTAPQLEVPVMGLLAPRRAEEGVRAFGLMPPAALPAPDCVPEIPPSHQPASRHSARPVGSTSAAVSGGNEVGSGRAAHAENQASASSAAIRVARRILRILSLPALISS
jgi:hypothetical protein